MNLGLAKDLQDVQGNPEEFEFLVHKNLKHNLLIFLMMPKGIQKCIQNTTMTSNTDLIKMSLPPLDNHRKLQFFILFSTLTTSQSQSLLKYLQGLRKNPRYLKPNSSLSTVKVNIF